MTSAAKVGIVMLIALAVLGYFVLRIEDINLSRSRTTRVVKAVFEDVAGLDDESAVRIAGVRKGHVTDIKVLPDGRAEVTLQVDDDVPLHANAAGQGRQPRPARREVHRARSGHAERAGAVRQTGASMLPGTQPATFDDVTDQVAAIAEDVKAITDVDARGHGRTERTAAPRGDRRERPRHHRRRARC